MDVFVGFRVKYHSFEPYHALLTRQNALKRLQLGFRDDFMTKRPILRQNVQIYAFSSIFTCSSFETSNFTPKTSNFDIGDHNPNPNPNPNCGQVSKFG